MRRLKQTRVYITFFAAVVQKYSSGDDFGPNVMVTGNWKICIETKCTY